MRPSFLDDLSAAEARRRAGRCSRPSQSTCARAGRRAGVVSHEIYCRYVLEYPVEDPDEDEDDDFDEGDEDEDDEDADDEEVETWQVSYLRPFR
jgi:hypothetical protein